MPRFEMINLAAILLSLVLPAGGCEKGSSRTASESTTPKEAAANSKTQKEKKEQPVGGREATSKINDGKDERVAIPEIEGCTRDNTMFYSGEVRNLKRTKDSLEITVFTDWNTTATLVQPEKSPKVIFRRDEKELTDEQVRKLEADLSGHEPKYRATVWVCLERDRKVIKVIELLDAEGTSRLPGSAPRRQ